MTRLGLVAFVALLGCEQAHSKLDDMPKPSPTAAAAADMAAGTGTIDERVARLEANFAKYHEVLDAVDNAYHQQKKQQEAQAEEEENNAPAPDARFAVDVSKDVQAGQVDGPPTALVTVVKAFDFACPYCEQTAKTMDDLVKDYGGKVRVVYKNLIIHGPAIPGHMGSCAAAKQGKYVQFKQAFWDKGFGPYKASGGKDQASLSEDNVLKIAEGIGGLDMTKFKADLKGEDCKKQIEVDMAENEKWHVNSTPSFFINGKPFQGQRDKDGFKRVIDEEIKVAEDSKVAGAEYYDKEVIAKGEKTFRNKKTPKPN